MYTAGSFCILIHGIIGTIGTSATILQNRTIGIGGTIGTSGMAVWKRTVGIGVMSSASRFCAKYKHSSLTDCSFSTSHIGRASYVAQATSYVCAKF